MLHTKFVEIGPPVLEIFERVFIWAWWTLIKNSFQAYHNDPSQ